MAIGRLESIYVTPRSGAVPEARSTARVVPGGGLEGDRHQRVPPGEGWIRELTLITAEALEDLARAGLALPPGGSRRQLTTRGLDLNALVGQRFRVGEVVLEGTKPCRPCDHLEALTRPGVKAALENKGGLCARIVTGGVLRVGDPVAPEALRE